MAEVPGEKQQSKGGGEGVSWSRALQLATGESVPVYLIKYVFPMAILGLVAAVLLQILLGDLLGSLGFVTYLIPVFLAFVILVYPKYVVDQQRIEIEQKMHLFITHLGVMSTTNIARIEMFKSLAQEDEYGALADEMNKIVKLVETWNMSLDEAARFQAKRTPSPILADFLERLAYNIGAGQDIEKFVMEEQSVVMSEYETMYNGALDDLDLLKDLFLSMTLSIAFIVVFATIMPILTGTPPMFLLLGSIFFYGFVELGFLYASKVKVPNDPIWYEPEEDTVLDKKVKRALLFSSIAVLILTVICMGLYLNFLPIGIDLPLPFYLAIPVTPIAYPGLIIRQQESKIKKRDRAFPSFIRSLGASEEAKKSTTTKVLESLQHKNFGKLTPEIRNLYKRMNMRIDQDLAWRHFAIESRSYLIQKFSEMYNRGRSKGGNTARLGSLIGDNFGEIMELRQQRNQTAVTMIGVLYGMTASSTFAFYIGIEVVKLMVKITDNLNLKPASGANRVNISQSLLHTDVYNVTNVTLIILLLILLNAIISSIMIRVIDGGHQINAFPHFVGLTWTGAIVAVITQIFVSGFINL